MKRSGEELVLPLAIFFLFAFVESCYATARFADKTSEINITLAGGTVSGIATFDYDGDGYLELQVSYDSSHGQFFEGNTTYNGFPQWTNATVAAYPQSSWPPAHSATPLPADYDNDGDMDLYVGSAYSYQRLYRNNGDGTFTEVGASVGIQDPGIYAGNVAAWGDYDGDGWNDLVIDGYGDMRLFHNEGASGTVTFTRTTNVLQGTRHVAIPGDFVWIDLDHDGDLDLFELLADYALPASSDVYINSGGSSPTLTTSTDSKWNWLRSLFANAVSVAQVTGSQGEYADFLSSAPLGGDIIRVNALGSYYGGLLPAGGGDAFILDYDLDGASDFYMYGHSGQQAVLMRNQGGVSFSDVSSDAQLDATGITCGVAADFDGDGDLDLFQGDPDGDSRLFMENFDTSVCTNCSPGADDPYNNFLEVRLKGHPAGQYHVDKTTNTDLIGTYLADQETGRGQWVQGNRSTSTGPSVPIVFGAGQASEFSLTVKWPNGVSTDFENLDVNQIVTIEDQSVPYVESSTVSGVKVYDQDTINLVFEWDTVGPSSEDEIEISVAPGSPGQNCGVYATTISSQDLDVAHTVTQTDLNTYHHTLTWEDQVCYQICKLQYVVHSKNAVAESWSGTKLITVKNCIRGL